MSLSRQDAVAAFARIAALAAVVSLSACGGDGGDSSSAPAPAPPASAPAPAPTLTASAAASGTTAGGQAVALSAVVANSTATVTWALSGPGSLSAASGASVNYVPPAPDTLSANTQATITATLGTLTQSVTLNVATAPGNTWELVETPSANAYSVIQANGGYVAVGAVGQIQRSADGVTWTPYRSGTPNDLFSVAYGTPGYVAVGASGTLVFSSDGITWTTEPSPQPDDSQADFASVTYADGRFIALATTGSSYVSTDGVTWTASTIASTSCGPMSDIAINATRLVAACGVIQYSDDGLHWTTPSSPTSAGQVAYGNGHFVALDDTSSVITSTDAVTWSAPVTVLPSAYRPKLRFFNGNFFLLDRTAAYQSADGVTWTTLAHTFSSLVFDIVPGVSSGYIVTGSNGLIQTSPDLTTWTDVGTGLHPMWLSVAFNNGTFIALDYNQHGFSSTDGRTWTPVTLPAGPWYRVTAANGQFLALGYGRLSTSPDGQAWTAHTVPPAIEYGSVTWGNGVWVLGGTLSDALVTSPDLQTWTTTFDDNKANTLGNVGVVYGQGKFVALQQDGTLVTSTDGVHWTVGTSFVTGGTAQALAFGDNGFVAVGGAFTSYHSADGLNWVERDVDINFNALTYGNGRYVAVGDNGETITSTDGVTWAPQSQPTDFQFFSVAYGNGTFVAVGVAGVMAVSTH